MTTTTTTNHTGRYVVVVDPLSTGHEYGPAFLAAGLRTVAVLTQGSPIPAVATTWHPGNFEDVHVFDGDVRWLAILLAQYDPLCIVPGSETGVELADALIEELLPGTGNVTGLSRARRDKWHMAQALARAGVPHLRQFCSADVEELAAWVADAGLSDHALVVKPPKSMATDEVHLVGPGEDLRPLARRILRTPNVGAAEPRRPRAGARRRRPSTSSTPTPSTAGTDWSTSAATPSPSVATGSACTTGSSSSRPTHPRSRSWPYIRLVLDAVGIRNGCGTPRS